MQLKAILIDENGHELVKTLAEVFGEAGEGYDHSISIWGGNILHLVRYDEQDANNFKKMHYSLFKINGGGFALELEQNVTNPTLPQDQPNDPFRSRHRTYIKKVPDPPDPCVKLAMDSQYFGYYKDAEEILEFDPFQSITGTNFNDFIVNNALANNVAGYAAKKFTVSGSSCVLAVPEQRKLPAMRSLKQILGSDSNPTLINLISFEA